MAKEESRIPMIRDQYYVRVFEKFFRDAQKEEKHLRRRVKTEIDKLHDCEGFLQKIEERINNLVRTSYSLPRSKNNESNHEVEKQEYRKDSDFIKECVDKIIQLLKKAVDEKKNKESCKSITNSLIAYRRKTNQREYSDKDQRLLEYGEELKRLLSLSADYDHVLNHDCVRILKRLLHHIDWLDVTESRNHINRFRQEIHHVSQSVHHIFIYERALERLVDHMHHRAYKLSKA